MMTTKRLLDVCDFQGGTQPPKDEWINDPCEGYVRMLQIRDYSQGDAKFIQYVKDTKKLHKCTKDDIMLSRYGYIGQAFIGLEGAYNVALVKVIKKAEIHTPYLLCYFQSYYFQHFLLSNVGARATIPGFNKDELENALIRIPEMCEQIEIASKITKVDELIGFHKQQLNVLDTLIKSRFIELFGDPVINPKGFPCYTVGEVIDFQGGSQPDKKYFEYEASPGNIRLIQIRDYKSDKYITYIPKTMAKRFCTADDIMIGRYGPPIFQILKGIEGSFNVALMKATPKMGNREFVRQFLKQDCLLEYLEGLSQRTAGQDGIQMDKLKAYPFPYPPMELQEQFAAFVEQTDKSKFYIVQMQILLRLLIRAIQQKTTEVLL